MWGNERRGDLSSKKKKKKGGNGGLRDDCTENAIMRSADQLSYLCGKPRYCWVVLFFSPKYLSEWRRLLGFVVPFKSSDMAMDG